jgi:hypothetical protein
VVLAPVVADVPTTDSPQLIGLDSRAISQRAPDNPFRPPLAAGF